MNFIAYNGAYYAVAYTMLINPIRSDFFFFFPQDWVLTFGS